MTTTAADNLPVRQSRDAETLMQADMPTTTKEETPSTAGGDYSHELFKPKAAYTRRERGASGNGPLTSQLSTAPVSQEKLDDEDEGLAGTNVSDEAVLPTPLAAMEDALFYLEPMQDVPHEADIAQHDIDMLHRAHHGDPFAVLGPHCFTMPGEEHKCIVVRFWRKDIREAVLRPIRKHNFAFNPSREADWVPMHQRCEWLYQAAFRVRPTPVLERRLRDDAKKGEAPTSVDDLIESTRLLYEVKVRYHGDASNSEFVVGDAYNYGLLLPSYDLHLFQTGSCWHIDNLMGSHIMEIDGVRGVRFAVWAPNAQFVSVVGDWNQWDGRAHPLRKRHEYSVWELFVPNIGAGEKYGYRIHSRANTDFIKIDPYAQEFENPPATASIVSSCDDAYKFAEDRFQWTDQDWIERRKKLTDKNEISRQPMSIYEVHLPSWMRGDGNSYLGYRELAHRLIAHVKKLNFTHVEFLPLAHHPFEGSWGYQVSGQYAPYSRLGNPDDLKYLINELHKNDIGVFLDFVPAHFVKDSWGLVYYDGEPCYEYADPREGEHKGWGTMMFNFRRSEVRSFLLGAAYHWLRRYHIDGLRIDAVSSMIYKNHCREDGDWVPNEYGGDANLQAISLLQELNWVIHREFSGVYTMAEESTSWKGVTDQEKGLGFDAKWDLGWMNDTLAYLCTPAPLRWEKHSKLTFRGLYMAHEKWVLPLSHDEVVSGKGSLLDKCGFSGSPFAERLRTLRALYGFQIGMPGRPLLFMGSEFGQGREWNEQRSIDWHEAQEPARSRVMDWVSDLLYLYKTEVALHRGDDEIWNFQWVDCDNAKDNVVAWLRKYGEWNNDILIICNFSGVKYHRYPIGVPHGGKWKTLLNSDDWKYGGEMHGTGTGIDVETTVGGRLGWPYCLWLDIPAFSCIIFKAPQPTPEQLQKARAKVTEVPIRAEEKTAAEEADAARLDAASQDKPVTSNPTTTTADDAVTRATVCAKATDVERKNETTTHGKTEDSTTE